MTGIPKPEHSQLNILREWLSDAKGGACFQSGSEARLWHEDEPDSAFVALNPSVGEGDSFTKFLIYLLLAIYHRFSSKGQKTGRIVDEESGLTSYDETNIDQCSQIFTTIISSILPVITILVLYVIHSTYWRIGASIGFTAVFATFLAVFSTARRVEIFAATAT